MNILRNRLFLAVALGHTTIDIFNSAGPVLIVFLSVSMGLSNAQIGLAVSLYALAGSISQPVFGWLGDQYGHRWLAGLGLAWTAGFMVLATVLAQSGDFLWLLIPFTLASLGSGAFHPVAVTSAGAVSIKRVATATALFFLFGQMGLAAGPLIGGIVLDYVGIKGLQLLALGALPIILFVLTAPYLPPARRAARKAAATVAKTVVAQKTAWGAISVLALLAAARSWAQLGTINFVPKLFQDKGWDPAAYGAITGVMWFASAILGVLAGQAADRWGRRKVMSIAMFAAAIPLFFLPLSDGWLAFVLALLAGGLTGAPHSIIVVVSQSLLPGRKAMASGLTLGFIFGTGAAASLSIGWLADTRSLPVAMQLGAGAALLSALLALVLPQTREAADLRT
ncbi:MAG TPA: MFS transporter [Chloroflexi bacterium]|nr:MFS transporter [Chloroflexota bacterium]